jgi:hypothetical protein
MFAFVPKNAHRALIMTQCPLRVNGNRGYRQSCCSCQQNNFLGFCALIVTSNYSSSSSSVYATFILASNACSNCNWNYRLSWNWSIYCIHQSCFVSWIPLLDISPNIDYLLPLLLFLNHVILLQFVFVRPKNIFGMACVILSFCSEGIWPKVLGCTLKSAYR